MRKIIFNVSVFIMISANLSFAQYYDSYNYQNAYNTENNTYQNNYNFYNYYEEFMKVLAKEALNPNSIYYNPSFANQYNNSNNQMSSNPYQYVMNAMNTASKNYNSSNNYNAENYEYYNEYNHNYNYQSYNNSGYDNTQIYKNPYEELMKMLETESKNPNSPYYSPNRNQDTQNNYYNNQNNNYAYNSENIYEITAERLIESAADNYYKNNLNNQNNNGNNNYNFYTPFKVPNIVLETANRTYPNVQICDIEMKNIGVYEVKLSNMIKLFIDRNGKLLYEEYCK
ncbi:hypothetical protein [uncultured Brachyspira sp.]|uniref:hypothetical protein n=1 Tax=uncultured Brachyspira sp. TaxID=221953 RepID=UPI0025CE67F5|nr:hypothetical protein [uncultured Brachyspira sp.]